MLMCQTLCTFHLAHIFQRGDSQSAYLGYTQGAPGWGPETKDLRNI